MRKVQKFFLSGCCFRFLRDLEVFVSQNKIRVNILGTRRLRIIIEKQGKCLVRLEHDWCIEYAAVSSTLTGKSADSAVGG